MKILVAGASTYGVKNAGDDAMLDVLCKRLRERKSELEVIFLARHPDKQFDRIHKIKSIKNIEHDTKKQSIGKWFFGFNPDDSVKHLETIRNTLEKVDLVIIGGNAFMEVFPNDFMRGVSSYCAVLAVWAKLFGKPFVLYGAAGHSPKQEMTKQIIQFLCKNASLVTLREEFIKKELVKTGVDKNKLKVFSDPVYGLDPIFDKNKGRMVLGKEGIKIKRKQVIGICFRHVYWKWNEEKFQKYAIKIAKLCDFLIEKLESEIVFIPNCIYEQSNPYQDDRYVSKIILKKIKNRKFTHILKNDLSLYERLSVYSLLDLVITNRRHVSIFSAIHHIPFIALEDELDWQMKPFMKQLDTNDQLISLNYSNKDVEKKVIRIWNKRGKISRSLSKNIPKLRKTSLKQVDMIIDLLN